jgi:hypothetical protein
MGFTYSDTSKGVDYGKWRKKTSEMMLTDIITIVDIAVTAISIVVTLVSIVQSARNSKHQNSNRPGKV